MTAKTRKFVLEYSVKRRFEYNSYPSEFDGSAIQQLLSQSGLYSEVNVDLTNVKLYIEEEES